MKLSFFFTLILLSCVSEAKLKVFTTTTNLADLVKQIGGDQVVVESLCKGTQDPHFLEARPSYTFKLSKADLLVSIGADLEVGWLPLVVRGSRNPKLRIGQKRRLIASQYVKLLGIDRDNVSRSKGDVHPEGNPHFMLSPLKSIDVAKALRDRLKLLDLKHSSVFDKNTDAYIDKIKTMMGKWRQSIKKGIKVISYHKTLTYFYKDFGINNVDVLEPKPGIPPTAAHILSIISKVKKMNINKIIVENYFDDTVAKRVQRDAPKISIHTVPVAVNGQKGINNLFDLYSFLVSKVSIK